MEASPKNEQTGVLAIRLLNFMAFEDTGWIDLKPITLLFGRNSSGKSAIIRALRLLKQSLQADLKTGPLVFQSRAGLDQGAFENTVHLMNKDEKRYIVFSFRCSLAGKQSEYEVEWFKEKINTLRKKQNIDELVPYDLTGEWPNWLDVHIGFADIGTGSGAKREEKIVPALLRIESPWSIAEEQRYPTTVFAIEKLQEKVLDKKTKEYIDGPAKKLGVNWFFWSDIIRQRGWPDLRLEQGETGFWPLLRPSVGATAAASSATEFEIVNNITTSLRKDIEHFFKSIVYLGPLRPEARRIYHLEHLEAMEWEQMGRGALADYVSNKIDAPELDALNEWVRKLEFGFAVSSPQSSLIKELAALFVIEIIENEAGFRVNLADVGSGVAQVLPVVMQGLLAKPGTMIIVEQPELHLHPSAQAVLADVLIKKSHEGVRFLVETHSEHILLRLQRRIAETTFDKLVAQRSKNAEKNEPRNEGPELVSENFTLIFIYRSEMESNVEKIKADSHGQLEAPSSKFEDFFRGDYEDVVSRNKTIGGIIQMEHIDENSH